MVDKMVPFKSSTGRVIAEIPANILKRSLHQNQLGMRYLVKGKTKEAIRYFNKVLRKFPKYYAALNNLALAYFLEGQYQKAISYAKQALKADSENILSMALIAESYVALGQFEEAKSYLERALSLVKKYDYPEQYIAKIIEAVVVYGDDKTAWAVYRYFRENLKNVTLALLAGGIAATNDKKYKDAVELLQKIRSKVKFADEIIKMIDYAQKRRLKLPRIGIDVFSSKMLSRNSPIEQLANDDYLKTKALFSLFRDDLSMSDKIQNLRFLMLSEDDAVFKFLMGVLTDDKLPDDLKKYILTELAANGHISEKDKIKITLDGRTETITGKEILKEIEIREINALINRGLSLKQSGRIDEAEELFRKAIEQYPDTPELYVNLANILRQKKQFDEAEKLFKKSLEIRDNPVSRLNLTALYLQMNRIAEAKDIFSPVKRDDLTEESLKRMYDYLEKMIKSKEEQSAEN
ncbi:MAG: tetratricopeptide repeat protein [Candidatus Asgardarchaeia archaeon]